ncbi:IclR family transcriptional regulator [Achromobacter sp. UMC71]|uniref:IclR family transcriptional regulator n=1 Tax=Achromobacter sp. UMC71 TaxID=1862320 RepID=UPI001602C454|nr:IclR family transcriptional regulator [Achromobacter sp. UMC71]MBB1627296.1 hypothetical protein [Achromobacter sp. UMC71]
MASLENAAIILRLINSLHRKVTVTDLVEHLDMPKSSASRLLAQMKDLGLLEREDSTRAYGPGVIILELSRLVRETTTLSAQMQDALKRLTAQSGHTGYISVLEGRDIMVLHVQQGTQPLRVTTYPGHRSPSWATSTGRVLLARDSDADVAKRLGKQLPFISDNAPRTVQDVQALLQGVRESGYAVAINEAVPGVASISCAVSDPVSMERFAMCLSFPAAQADAASVQALAADLLAQASNLGRMVCDPAWGSPVPVTQV